MPPGLDIHNPWATSSSASVNTMQCQNASQECHWEQNTGRGIDKHQVKAVLHPSSSTEGLRCLWAPCHSWVLQITCNKSSTDCTPAAGAKEGHRYPRAPGGGWSEAQDRSHCSFHPIPFTDARSEVTPTPRLTSLQVCTPKREINVLLLLNQYN